MSNRDELDRLMMLLRSMNGEENVIEHMEAEGQQSVVNNTMMAKEMSPSREEWEQLEFIFTDIPNDDILCRAKMPNGWSMRATDHSMWNEILDENGMRRGSMFYKAAFYDRSAHMSLERRYGICVDYSTSEIYFGNSNEKLFVAGNVHISKDASREEILARYKEEDRLKSIAKQYGNENYPDWESVHAYWNNNQETSLSYSQRNKK